MVSIQPPRSPWGTGGVLLYRAICKGWTKKKSSSERCRWERFPVQSSVLQIRHPKWSFFPKDKPLPVMSREQSEPQQHQGGKCSFEWHCVSRQSLLSNFVPGWFRYSCTVISAEACCSSWACIATCPLASNPNVMGFKLFC